MRRIRCPRLLLPRLIALGIAAGVLASIPTAHAANAPSAPNPTPSTSASSPSVDPNRATFGVQPASATKVDTRPYLSYSATPGASTDDHVAIVNHSLIPLTLAVYATDALNTDTGGFTLLPGAATPKDAGSWLQVTLPDGGKTVTVPAQASNDSPPGVVILPIHINIPANAAPGDHAAGVLAALTTASNDPNNPNVQLDQRVATRVYVRIAGPIHPGLKIEKITTRISGKVSPLKGGDVTVTYRVHNVGNVNLGGRSHVVIQGLLGTRSVAPVVDFPLLLPGSSVDFTAHVKSVYPEILEKVTVSVQPLTLQGDVDPGLPKAYSASRHFWFVPWILIAIIVLLGVLAGLGWRYWRRKSNSGAGPTASKDDPVTASAEVRAFVPKGRRR
jgi:hypothetical protein